MHSAPYRVKVGLATCGIASGAAKVYSALEQALQGTDVRLERTGCIGMCYCEPLVEVIAPGGESYMYGKVTPEDVPRLVEEHLKQGKPVRELLIMGEGRGNRRLQLSAGAASHPA